MGRYTRWGVGTIAISGLLLLGFAGWGKLALEPAMATRSQTVRSGSNSPVQKAPRHMAQRNQASDPMLVNANTRFGFKLFSAIVKQDSTKNVFVSPSSVAIALAMVYNGAGGETQQAIARSLEVQGMSLPDLNRANADLKNLLENADPQVQLAIANSLWARQGVPFKPDFIQRNQQFYQAEVTELNFANPQAVATINNWVSQNTRNKITKIVDRLTAEDVMVLINAIYFKGNWTRKFDPQKTTKEPFYPLNGSQKSHPMMNQSGEYRYYENNQFQSVSLPYGSGQRMNMIVLLPKKTSSLAELQRTLTAKNWEQWMRQLRSRRGAIQIPRFKLEYETELTKVLSQLGMASAFGNRADFSGISQIPTKIDQVKHKTFVEVNEEGTEAAAVTSIGIRATSVMPVEEPFNLKVDRPFFCAIQDNQTGTVLFMGAIVNPQV